MDRSELLFAEAKKVLPGGVNSPVRAFRAVGMAPRFIARADGAHIYDVDGRDYIDYVCSWGPMILGHNHPVIREAVEAAIGDGLSFGAPTEREVEMAELMVELVPNIEMVRMVSSGTEAVMSALRLARGATGREKLIKFEGCYHGHSDCMLVKAGSSALAGGCASSAGVPAGTAKDTLTAQFNDLASVEALLEENPGQVAAIIVEPVAANMGVVGPADGFLQGLRTLCDRHGALLIFDEVITGFRLALGGAQAYFGVRADLVTFGKIIGGGMPVGAYCGSRALMEQVAPCGPVYQAGTLSGNPIAMAAGLAQLRYLQAHPEVYTQIETYAQTLAQGLRAIVARTGAAVQINQIGSLVAPFFTPGAVDGFSAAMGSDLQAYARYFGGMLDRGISLAPAQFEAMFVSAAHTEADLRQTLSAAEAVLSAPGFGKR
ncbi:MAG: glutamate-1-semialdehyde 2,1-aminomutase [Pseudoflavonifractor sp.]